MLKLMRVMAVIVALAMLPAVAGAQTLQAGATDAQITLAAFPTDVESAKNMPAAQAAAIVGGGLIGAAVADSFLGGGLFTVVGVLVGAVAGNSWYDRHYWPF